MENSMTMERIIFSGSGGQGLLFIGKLLANMLLDRCAHLTFFPSYGAEVRGGTSHCQVIYSSEEIASPIVEEADSLVLMNQPSVDRFLPCLVSGGIAVVNSSLARAPEGADFPLVPATEIAVETGDIRAANIVMFGAYLCIRSLFTLEEAERSLVAAFKGKGRQLTDINTAALRRGWEYGEKSPLQT